LRVPKFFLRGANFDFGPYHENCLLRPCLTVFSVRQSFHNVQGRSKQFLWYGPELKLKLEAPIFFAPLSSYCIIAPTTNFRLNGVLLEGGAGGGVAANAVFWIKFLPSYYGATSRGTGGLPLTTALIMCVEPSSMLSGLPFCQCRTFLGISLSNLSILKKYMKKCLLILSNCFTSLSWVAVNDSKSLVVPVK
jgi:hypothetical protein